MTTTAKWVSLIKTTALALLMAWVLVKLLRNTGMACVPVRCSADGFRYGAQLFAAGLALALVGRAFLTLPTRSVAAPPDAGLFRSMAVGLVVLIAYVYVRSIFNQFVVNLPVTRPEVLGLVVLAGAALVWAGRAREPHPESSVRGNGLPIDLVLLFLLCVVMADRELPREMMLSSDPDVHVFFGIQVERFGGVPFHQRDWGSQGFNYPAGSAVVLFLWQMVSGLDPRNLLVVLPVLFSFVAALVIAETAGSDVDRVGHRLVLKLAAVALTAAGFVFPLFKEYAHLEGAARQMSVLPVAVFLSGVVAFVTHGDTARAERVWLPVLTMCALAALNPANVVVPAVLLCAMWVYGRLQGWRSGYLVGVLLAALALLVLEPYYHGLLGIAKQARVDTVIYDDRLVIKALPEVVSGAWMSWTDGSAAILREFAVLFAETGRPLFLTFLLAGLAGLFVVHPGARPKRAGWLALIVFVVLLYLVFGFARSLLDDRRFFLLGPYVFFNMTQYKALLVILLVSLTLGRLMRWPWVGLVLAVAVAAGATLGVMYAVRSEQGMYLEPRKTYCGVYGCLPDSDRRLLQAFEQQVREGRFPPQDGHVPRVLIPNAFKRTEHEAWILPVASARVLPYFDVLPAAFYYYQGDLNYSTASYQARVCDTLDRTWLRAQHIQYIYLPSGRQDACVAGMETLIQTEEVILREGQAYLIKLR
jgi:hypothetical protein